MIRKAITGIGAAALLLMMLYTVLNVIVRSTTGTPLPAAVELITRWWMVPLVFCGWILAHLVREHIIVDFVVDGAGRRAQPIMAFINAVLLILFLGLVSYAGFLGALENQTRNEYGIDTGWPVWITRYAVPALTVVFIGYVVHDGWAWLSRRKKGTDQPDEETEAVVASNAPTTGDGHVN